jgi:4-diphosphocytidyl-2-C-methyl-D-erythritol kinase
MREEGTAPASVGSPDAMIAALRQRDAAVLAEALGNDLEPAALALRPALRLTLDAGAAAGALAGLVSGSGPTCVFLCRDNAHAVQVSAALTAAGVCRAARTAAGPVAGARLI